MIRRDLDSCRRIVASVFMAAGVNEEAAMKQSDLFVMTEAKGVLSHGIALTWKYVQQFQKGTLNTKPNIAIVREAPAMAVIDGDAGLGPIVMSQAIEIAMEKACKTGVASVTVTNLQHYAAGLYYIDVPVENGMMITMVANAIKSMAPFGGTRPYFGTNPFTFASPAGKFPPYCLDMATSVCAGNKLENAMNEGKQVPLGLGLDRDGRPTTDPQEILRHGSQLPFGGAKGSGIAGMIAIMSGMLSGGAYRDDVVALCRDKSKPSNFGSYINVVDISKFMEMGEFAGRMEIWVQDILDNPPAEGFERVVYPGYPEGLKRREAVEKGLVISDIAMENLKRAAELVGVDVEGLLRQAEI